MIRRAIYWAVGGLIICVARDASVAWALIITIATAVIGAL